MANTAKDIIIYPSRRSTTTDPYMVFCANDDVKSANIVLSVLTKSNGTLAFTSNVGANIEISSILTIANDYTDGCIFIAYDSTGIPVMRVMANGRVIIDPLVTSGSKITIGPTAPTGNAANDIWIDIS